MRTRQEPDWWRRPNLTRRRLYLRRPLFEVPGTGRTPGTGSDRDSIAHAVGTSGVGRIVFLSSHGAERESGTGPVRALHYAEAQLTATGVPITMLRAAYFIENWAPVLPVAREQGVLPTFLPADFRFPTQATADIGRIAADALLRRHTGVRVIEIEGPQHASPRDVAQAI